MLTRWFRFFGSGRGAPPSARPVVALTALAALALGSGCTTLGLGNGCGECGGFRPLSGLRAMRTTNDCDGGGGCGLGGGLFRHKWFGGGGNAVPMGGACEPGIVTGGAVVGAPAAVIPAPGAVIPSPPPAAADEMPPDLNLKPVDPGASGGSDAQGKANGSGVAPSSYETTLPRAGTATGARGRPAAVGRRPGSPVDEVLSELPPLAAHVPASSVAEEAGPRPEPAPTHANNPVATADLPPPVAGGGLGAAPGIARFRNVKPFLAGGSAPAAGGWAWLAEKGYKAVLDLRSRAEVQPADLAALDQQGLTHIALPTAPEAIDEAHLDRFEAVLAQVGHRNLYFFDADGSRAAALWFAHRVIAGELEPAAAEAEAAEMGPKDPRSWPAALALIARRKPAAPAASVEPKPSAEPAAVAQAPAALPLVAQAEAPAPILPDPAPAEEAAPPAPADPAPRDPTAWRPYAAVVLTGLSVPLAYFGRTALSLRSALRASLPGPMRRPKPLPASSGE